jgi:hypothetical protein
MAYMNQDKKSKIAAALKQVVPAGWKYSLSVRHHSTIVMTIASAPVDLIGKLYDTDRKEISVNQYWANEHLKECAEKQIILKILECLNLDNFDNSDVMTDYFHVGHYVNLNIGTWAKPFVVNEQLKKAA